MSGGTGISADALHARLTEVLAPTELQVVDESADHAGHLGADGNGSGTHFRVRICSPAFAGQPRKAYFRRNGRPLKLVQPETRLVGSFFRQSLLASPRGRALFVFMGFR